MSAALIGLIVLGFTPGCRLGYDVLNAPVKQPPNAAPHDAGTDSGSAGAADAALESDAAVGGAGGSTGPTPAGQGGEAGRASGGAGAAGRAGAPAAGTGAGDDAGSEADEMVGGLRLSQILGFYSNSAWGDMVLRKQADEIWGVYQYEGGTLAGTITGEGVFVGWWSQLPSRVGTDAGEVEFRWSQTNGGAVIALNGRWRYGTAGTWLENWDLDLVTDRTAPSALTTRFDNPDAFKRHP